MLTIKSDKTSLLDLSINELRTVAWEHLDVTEFVEELANPKLLARLMYGSNKEILCELSEYRDYLMECHEATIAKMIDALKACNYRSIHLDSCMFADQKQYSANFLEKYGDCIPLNYIERQKSLTPELLEKYHRHMDMSDFWCYFDRTIGMNRLSEFIQYKDGMFAETILESEIMRYCTSAELISNGLEVPYYYNNVMTEQRVMSGEPCNDGQRSFSIWLRKYRRVYNNPNGFPTWDNLLELYKQYPRMNQHGYVDWLYSRAVRNDDELVNEYNEHLSYNPKNITVDTYEEVTGDNNEVAKENYIIEFSDVLNVTKRTPARDPVTGRFISQAV